jgi:hypothetical protein
MYSKIKQFLDAAPKALKSANEIYNFARNKYKQVMGVFPDGLDDVFLKRGSAEMQDVRQKVVKFPEGGKDKTDFFSTRPDPRVKQPEGAKMDVQRAHENLSGGSNYAQGDTKYNADVLADEIARQRKLIPDDGIADSSDLDFKTKTDLYDEAYSYLTGLRFLNKPPKKEGIKTIDLAKELEELTNKNLKDKGLGNIKLGDKLPPPKNKKPDVDPVLQKSEDQKQMFLDFGKRTETEAETIARMNKQNKDAVKRLKDKKEKDLGDKLKDFDGDPDALAQGGRIGFSEGSRREFDPSNFIEQMTQDMIKKSPDGIVMDPTNRVEDLTTADRPTKPKIKAEPFDPYGPNAPFYFNQDRPELSQTLVYDDGTIYYKDTGEYYNIETGVRVPGPSKNAKPVPRTLEAASGGRIGFSGGGAGFAGNQMEGVLPEQEPMGPVFETNDPRKAAKEVITRMAGPAGLVNIPVGGGFGFGVGFGSQRNMDVGFGFNPQNPNFDFSGGLGILDGKPSVGFEFRKQFKDGSKPPNPGRRNFMKLMAGLASLPVVGKLFKGAKVAEKVVQLKNTTTTMPAWFPQFVDKFISKGVGKKIDQDLMEFTNPNLPNIKVTKADDGRVFVEGQNDYYKNYEIDYTPPGYEVIDEKTGKAVKKPGDFRAQEEVPVNVDPDGNADFDAEVLESVDDILSSDARAMEEFATGKKIKEMKRGEYSVGQAEARADAARKGEDFATGGLAYMLGE